MKRASILLLALLVWTTVRDEGAMAAAKPGRDSASLPLREVFAYLLRPRTVLYTCVGAGLQLLVVSSVWAWMPSYLNRYYGLAPDVAGLRTGLVVLLGAVGSVGWSLLADRLSRRERRARLYVPAFVAVLTTCFMCVAFGAVAPGPTQFLLILAGASVMTGTIGAVAAVVVDVVNPVIRATATAVLSLTQNLLGLAAGPILGGVLSDAYGLQFAMAVVPLFGLAAAGVLVLAARTYEKDRSAIAAFEPANVNGLAAQPA